jgi:predicted RNA methylase
LFCFYQTVDVRLSSAVSSADLVRGVRGAIAVARRRVGPRLLAAIDIGAGAGILGFGAYLGFRTARS